MSDYLLTSENRTVSTEHYGVDMVYSVCGVVVYGCMSIGGC